MISYDAIKSGEVAVPVKATVAKEIGALPAMVKAAADKLASATTSAEVLDAKDAAALVYDASKRAARMAKAKKAHDELIAAAHRAQADALEIEAAAKRRLADEYDGGQERGEIVGPKGGGDSTVPSRNAATAADVGLTRKQVHEARQVRDAEQAQPGIVRQTLDDKLAVGEEPTRAAVNAAVAKVFGKTQPVDQRTDAERDANTIQSAWDCSGDEGRAMFLARNNLQFQAKASEDNGRTSAAEGAPMTGEASRSIVGDDTGEGDGRDVEASGGAASVTTNSPSAGTPVEAVADPQAPAQAVTAKVSSSEAPPPGVTETAEAPSSSPEASAAHSPDPRSGGGATAVPANQAPQLPAQNGDVSHVDGQDGAKPRTWNGHAGQEDASAAQDRNEPVSASGATVTSPRPGCLSPTNCRIKFQTSALCWKCRDAQTKARAA